MKFSEYPYLRPDINDFSKNFQSLLQKFEAGNSFEEQDKALLEINNTVKDFDTTINVANVRYSLDTTNKKHGEDKEYFTGILPVFLEEIRKFNELLLKSPYLKEFENKYGKCLVNGAKHELKTFSEKVKDEFTEEANLETEFYKIKAEGKVKYEGKDVPVFAMRKLTDSPDREIRKKAAEAIMELNNNRKEKISEIFDRLIKVRTQMARKLGYDNYVGLGYEKMEKEFTTADAAKFRESLLKYVVPVASRLRERQRKRIGVDKLMHYDAPFKFKTGNPVPKGDSEWLIKQSIKMFSELSPETKEFIEFMTENGLLDLYSRVGKGRGGYATFFYTYKAPFIMGNMNGSSWDVHLITHEAGHAFQSFVTRDAEIMEQMNLTSDICEVHSMGMEFLTYDYMHNIFEEDTDKFLFEHLDDSVSRLSDMAVGDEFQEIIYSNPEMTNDERCMLWSSLQKKYESVLDPGNNEFLKGGNSWQNRNLFFTHPFYRIEYALAQFVAYQFLFKKKENHGQALKEYVAFCRLGGNYTFSESLKAAGLKNPFEEETVKEMSEKIEALLNEIDDSKF